MTLILSNGFWLDVYLPEGQVWPPSQFLPRHFQHSFTGKYQKCFVLIYYQFSKRVEKKILFHISHFCLTDRLTDKMFTEQMLRINLTSFKIYYQYHLPILLTILFVLLIILNTITRMIDNKVEYLDLKRRNLQDQQLSVQRQQVLHQIQQMQVYRQFRQKVLRNILKYSQTQ